MEAQERSQSQAQNNAAAQNSEIAKQAKELGEMQKKVQVEMVNMEEQKYVLLKIFY